ncbi:MAG: ABC transporter ATP-binding protein [Verrucomicrobia bacterium]|nr:ABC transporter ATP-binding protein [Verrucomicrobiota bacterium]MBU4291431.1 ABC transporter ATP-binding protein [Verrucomicrobiota bacterium]MBU4430457.1 ABC transporter ATP-binding protein [Verrucomicrobiota bacterium]MCG2679574.1 ABC transporter ATP-binding protein [Kiritimatiellia bacterium]
MNNPGSQTAPLLEIRNLKTWFPVRRGIFSSVTRHVRAVDGVSLSIGRQETLGLVGESGCGKTTLGRTLLGLDRATSGQVLFDGKDLLTLPSRARQILRPRLQMIFQDPYSSLNPRMTIKGIVTEGLVEHRLLRGTREQEAIRLLGEVGLPPDANYRYPFEFSGGQRQRISLARVLSLRPEFIVCDEAVSALDVSVQAQMLNLLMDLKERHALSYLFISHDLGVVKHISDRVAVMYLGHIVEEGRTEEIMDHPGHPYTQALIDAVCIPGRPRRRKIILSGEIPSPINPPPGCPFHPRCPRVMDVCRREYPAECRQGTRRVYCHLCGPKQE